jgi:DNA-binding beta-propeller fold protein YncE
MKEALLVCFLTLLALPSPASAASWSITDRIPIGGDGGWDYLVVQPETHRLFLSHASQVVVVDLKSKSIIGSIPAAGVHGIALATDLNCGFISNGAEGTVTAFDLATLRVEAKLTAQKNPDAICYEPMTKKVFAFNGRSGTATVIDAVQKKVLGEIELGGKPEFAQPDGAGSVFDCLEDKSQIIKIDAASQTIKERWNLPPDSEPSGLAIDPAHQRLFIGCGNKTMIVMNAATGEIIAQLPIGAGVDACAYDPIGHRAFASCGDGTMTVVQQSGSNQYVVSETAQTELKARTMAFDPTTATAYLPDAKFGPSPAPTAENPHPRAPVLSGSLELLVVAKNR